jgi:GNAT superfamily N-acetyltransferase
MDFRPINATPAKLAQYCDLFNTCFPGNDKFTPAYVDWLYRANPDGEAVGFDAWEGERLAAHYVCVPARARVHGIDARVLLSLNTATHPDFQGKGLFTQLAALTYDAGAEQQFDGCYGVANANSTPGFLRKLGFQLVRPLEARVGMGRLHTAPQTGEQLSFERVWDQHSLAWRCANPHNRVHHRRAGTQWQFHAAALGGGRVPVYAELPASGLALTPQEGPAPGALRLFIGLAPDEASSYWNYLSIPQRLRPSPLNLIWRSFMPGASALDGSAIRFSFLDFDAY